MIAPKAPYLFDPSKEKLPEPQLRLVKLGWVDSRGCSENWATFEQLREHDLCVVWSVGWVINETDEYIQICPHVGTDPDQGCGDMTIPKIAIKHREDA